MSNHIHPYPVYKLGKVEGFMDSVDQDPFYTKKRFFKKNSPLKAYLHKYYQEEIDSTDEYELPTILDLIRKRIRNKEMFDTNNPFVVECDSELTEALGVSHILTQKVQFEVIKQLIPTAEDYIRTEGNDSIEYKNDKFQTTTILFAPEWARMTSIAFRAQMELRKLKNGQVYKPKDEFRAMLLEDGAITQDETLFDISELIKRVGLIALKTCKIPTTQKQSILLVKDTPIGQLFGVRAIDTRQLDGLILQNVEYEPPRQKTIQEEAKDLMFRAIMALNNSRQERGAATSRQTPEYTRRMIDELEPGSALQIDDGTTIFFNM